MNVVDSTWIAIVGIATLLTLVYQVRRGKSPTVAIIDAVATLVITTLVVMFLFSALGWF
jgi:hypothetical protein